MNEKLEMEKRIATIQMKSALPFTKQYLEGYLAGIKIAEKYLR